MTYLSSVLIPALTAQDELEVALRHNGTSYVSVGWKPTEGIVRQCNDQIPRYMAVGTCDNYRIASLADQIVIAYPT